MDFNARPTELSTEVIEALRTSFKSEVRTGIHVSDLVFPRKAWMQRHFPNLDLSDDECLYFICGRAHHGIIENLIASDKMKEYGLEWNGVTGTVDIMKDTGIPVEFKTTRSAKQWSMKNLPSHYVRQLGYYVAMHNRDAPEGVGELLILYLARRERDFMLRERSRPVLKSYSITYPNLDLIRGEMLLRKAMVMQSFAPPVETCEKWMCLLCKFHQVECEGCP